MATHEIVAVKEQRKPGEQKLGNVEITSPCGKWTGKAKRMQDHHVRICDRCQELIRQQQPSS